jgi:hypothetical protein
MLLAAEAAGEAEAALELLVRWGLLDRGYLVGLGLLPEMDNPPGAYAPAAVSAATPASAGAVRWQTYAVSCARGAGGAHSSSC